MDIDGENVLERLGETGRQDSCVAGGREHKLCQKHGREACKGDGARLRSGLYDDPPAFPDVDAQVMVFEHSHAHEGVYANRPGFDVSQLSVPEHRNAIHVESSLAAVGQDRLAVTHNR